MSDKKVIICECCGENEAVQQYDFEMQCDDCLREALSREDEIWFFDGSGMVGD